MFKLVIAHSNSGKTTFLLNYIKENENTDKKALFILGDGENISSIKLKAEKMLGMNYRTIRNEVIFFEMDYEKDFDFLLDKISSAEEELILIDAAHLFNFYSAERLNKLRNISAELNKDIVVSLQASRHRNNDNIIKDVPAFQGLEGDFVKLVSPKIPFLLRFGDKGINDFIRGLRWFRRYILAQDIVTGEERKIYLNS